MEDKVASALVVSCSANASLARRPADGISVDPLPRTIDLMKLWFLNQWAGPFPQPYEDEALARGIYNVSARKSALFDSLEPCLADFRLTNATQRVANSSERVAFLQDSQYLVLPPTHVQFATFNIPRRRGTASAESKNGVNPPILCLDASADFTVGVRLYNMFTQSVLSGAYGCARQEHLQLCMQLLLFLVHQKCRYVNSC